MFKLNYVVIPLITVGVGFLGRFFTDAGMAWYNAEMIAPAYLPPKIIFPIVWNLIFILTTIAALYVWNRMQHLHNFKLIIGLFIANAFLNVFWTYLFFYKRLIGVSVFDAAALLVTIIALIALIWPYKKGVALLLAPYAAWVAFAVGLNAHIWLLN